MAGKIKFVKRGGAVAASIDEDDLAAHEWGSNAPDPLAKVRSQDLELPHEVSVLYFNSGADYQQGTQKAERQAGNGVNVLSIPLPVVMDDTKAKQVADVNLYNAWTQRTSYTLQLSRKWSKIEPTDVLDVTYNGTTLRMRVTKKDDAKPGIITLDCVAEDSAIYTQSGAGASSSNIPTQGINIPVQTLAVYLDIPAIRDNDTDAGLYFAACGYRSGWSGCALFKSDDEGATYSRVFSVDADAAIGNATTALGDFYGGNIFDELNTVTVQMFNGTLSSTTELAVLNNANIAVLGDEIIQFKNAELVSAGVYKLSGLLRGVRGTEWAMGTHAVGDRFVLADATTWRRIALPTSDIGLTKGYKAVSFGMTLQQTQSTGLTCTGAALECYAPVQVGAGRDASDNITFTWIRRNRVSGEWRDYVDVLMSEGSESYEIDVYSDSNLTTVVRTLTATTNSVSYSAANQVTDFGIAQSELNVKIYQMSAIVGRGIPAVETIFVPKPAVFSTQWRIYITENQGYLYASQIAEIEMRDKVGGVNQCVGGTASTSSAGSPAANAFDGNSSTNWVTGFVSPPQWIQYTFLSAVNVGELYIKVATADYAPKGWKLQYYNGSTWVDRYIKTNEPTWAATEARTYTI